VIFLKRLKAMRINENEIDNLIAAIRRRDMNEKKSLKKYGSSLARIKSRIGFYPTCKEGGAR